MKNIAGKIKLAIAWLKSNLAMCLIAIFLLALIRFFGGENFEGWPPVLAMWALCVVGFFNIPTEEEWQKYREQHPYDGM